MFDEVLQRKSGIEANSVDPRSEYMFCAVLSWSTLQKQLILSPALQEKKYIWAKKNILSYKSISFWLMAMHCEF